MKRFQNARFDKVKVIYNGFIGLSVLLVALSMWTYATRVTEQAVQVTTITMQGASGWLAAHFLGSVLGNRCPSSIFGTKEGPCVGPVCSTGGPTLKEGNAWASRVSSQCNLSHS